MFQFIPRRVTIFLFLWRLVFSEDSAECFYGAGRLDSVRELSEVSQVHTNLFPHLPFFFLNGEAFDPTRFRGKVLLVNVFATYCPPCLEEFPALNRLFVRAQGYPLQIVGLCADLRKGEKLKQFVDRLGIRFPVAFSSSTASLDPLRITAYPTTFLVDHRGRIVRRILGPKHWDSEEWWSVFLSLFPEELDLPEF